MKAYFVSKKRAYDAVVIPDSDRFVIVDAAVLRRYLSAAPEFASWEGENLEGVTPEAFGEVLAMRDEGAPPDILNLELWTRRVQAHLRARGGEG